MWYGYDLRYQYLFLLVFALLFELLIVKRVTTKLFLWYLLIHPRTESVKTVLPVTISLPFCFVQFLCRNSILSNGM